MKRLILFLLGPSGSGKTELSLLLARRLNCEIVSADSMLVYRGMDIGTAKPTPDQRKTIPHHLIDVVSPRRNFSVYEHRKRALRAIQDILGRGRLPLVVGGSGLYVEALWKGLSGYPAGNMRLRQKLIQEARQKGVSALYTKLQAIDPLRARQIHPHDQKRIIRALEIAVQGKIPSGWHQERESLEALGYRVLVFALKRERSDLYERINRRVEKMFQKGLLQEVARLRKIGFSKTARQALGYRQILESSSAAKGNCLSRLELIRLIQRHTRQFARRQLTWLRRERGIRWIPWGKEESVKKVCDKIIKEFRKDRGY